MDKTTLYKKLDINVSEEFKYYENLSALLEEDDFIETNLLKDLIKDLDKDILAELMESYFEEFLKNIPDSETDLYITAETYGEGLSGMIFEDMSDEDISDLAEGIADFRKWYVLDCNAYDRINNCELNIRDARYNILGANLLGEKVDYEFSEVLGL
ncbi:MAG: hypothetical protein KBS63_06505 [Clostridiales bacterium]|nr:hypothetical protein [Candidatus Crickella caballi]